MNIVRRSNNISIGALVVAGLFLISVIFVILSSVTHAGNGTTAGPGRLVTIYDRNIEKAIVTQAETVGDALKEAGVDFDNKDLVEPSVDNKLIASSYKVNIYRARPVIVADGDMRVKITTPYQTAGQIVESAGIKLFDEDKTILERTDDIIAEGAGLKLTIIRSTPINLTLFGNTSVIRTQARTVGEMLGEKGIKLGVDDRVSPDIGIAITDGLVVRIWREGAQTVASEEEIDFEVERIENADMNVGYMEVQTAGEKGLRSVTYQITVQDGQEVSRKEITSLTTKQPKKQVEVIGVKGKYTTPSENENITWDYLISKGFSHIQTAGIMGNLMQEHGFNTTDTSGGLGLAQWTGSRRANLINMYPDSYTNIYSQLDYLMFELNGSYSAVRDAILADNSLDPTNVVQIFQDKFEKCGTCMESKRIEYARNILASH